MKHASRLALSLLVIATLSAVGFAQSHWESHTKRTFRDVIAANSQTSAPAADYVISADLFTSKSEVIFGGQHRPISDAKRKFVSLWCETRNLPAATADKLTEEYLFTQDGVDYWTLVAPELKPFIEKELTKGDKVRVFFFFVGGYDGKRKIDWVLLVEEFKKL